MSAAVVKPEKPSELAARRVLEAEFGDVLDRVPETGDKPIVDYRTTDSTRGIEVKRLTSEGFLELGDAFGRAETSVNTPRLTGWWAVLVDRPALSTVWPAGTQPAPFPTGPAPRLKKLVKDLVEHFEVLERHGVHHTETPLPPQLMPADLATALRQIAARSANAQYYRTPAPHGQQGSVQLLLGSGYVRTGQADTLVDRIDQWLASGDSDNLRDSLDNEPPGTERHAFLVFDGATEPEYRSAVESGTAFCPIRPPTLVPEIDVLWFLVGPVACRYDRQSGWSVRLALPEPSTPSSNST